MNWQNIINAFQLNNNFVVNQHVDPIATINFDSFVLYRKRMLQLKWNL